MDFIKLADWIQNLDFEINIKKIKLSDGIVDVVVQLNDEIVYVVVKKEVRPQHLGIFEAMAKERRPFMIAADYITPKAKDGLKERKINYIDSYGNAFINLEQLKLYIEQGNAKPVYGENTNKAFTKSGAQVIFQLLKNSDFINSNHRDIAKTSKVSLGTVSNVMNGLFDSGFLVKWKSGNNFQLVNKKKLLEKWITIINEKTLPAYLVGNYRMAGINQNNYKNINLDEQAFWSGEPAAAELTNYLYPEKLDLFTTKSKIDISKDYHLLPDSFGNVVVYKPFWDTSNIEDYFIIEDWKREINKRPRTVHPLLVYAQLVYSGNSRNIETAQLIFNEYIEPNL